MKSSNADRSSKVEKFKLFVKLLTFQPFNKLMGTSVPAWEYISIAVY